MKTIADYKSNFVLFEIVKIENGFLFVQTGLTEENKNYKVCCYFATLKEAFDSFKYYIEMVGGNICYSVEQISY